MERHLEDTARVARLLAQLTLSADALDSLGVSLDVGGARVLDLIELLAYAHDVGKCSPTFQGQARELASRLDYDGLSFERPPSPFRHDAISGAAVASFVRSRNGGAALAGALAATVSGHHSLPTEINRDIRADAKADKEWVPVRERLLAAAADRLGFNDFGDLRTPDAGVVLTLAGLVCVADWIASDSSRFPVTAGDRPSSEQLAVAAVMSSTWCVPDSPPRVDFEHACGVAPRASQRAMVDALSNMDGPMLVLLEERTGGGKTESAYWAILRGLQEGARGVYIALPTRATAGQIHSRTQQFVSRLWPERAPALRLLHGGLYARPDEFCPSSVDHRAGDPDAREFFDGPRRGLLAPLAVGTIDQALLAVLRARHYPVRLWGLAQKVVVVDEVHAYDAFTGMLLERMVEWLAEVDCTVVLLSATLPAARRSKLIDAFRRGRHEAPAPLTSTAAYPRLTTSSRAGTTVTAIDDDRPSRSVAVRSREIANDATAVAAAVSEAVTGGGCIAVVCSTVSSAQERYAALVGTPGADVILLHARLRPLERMPVERTLIRQLGRQATADTRPSRLIVVSTQIIEQSLDLDFDAVFSDLAPVDLLIQRAGRLHRHAGRARPDRHASPVLTVLDTENVLPSAASAVYAKSILARTRIVLSARDRIVEPDDLDELIARVYGDDVPAEATKAQREWIAVLDRDTHREAEERGGWARDGAIRPPGDDYLPWEGRRDVQADGDAPGMTARNAAVTRWSDRPAVSLVVLAPEEAHLLDQSSRSAAVDLLERAVSISDQRVVAPLLKHADRYQPASWTRIGALRYHFLAVLGATDLPIAWDPVLGVTVPD